LGVCILQTYFYAIFHETKHHTQAHFTFHALINSAFSLATSRTKVAEGFAGLWWPMLVKVAVEPCNICCHCTWSSNQTEGRAILASSNFFDQIPHQEEVKSQLVIKHHTKITKSNCLVHLGPKGQKQFYGPLPTTSIH
jgi:hypothetical protein